MEITYESEEVWEGRLDDGVKVQGLIQVGKHLGKIHVEIARQECERGQEVVAAILLWLAGAKDVAIKDQSWRRGVDLHEIWLGEKHTINFENLTWGAIDRDEGVWGRGISCWHANGLVFSSQNEVMSFS